MQKNWVLLRGLVRGVGHWSDFPEKIKRAFPEDRFEFLEIPGNGALYQKESPTRIDEAVESLRRQSQFIQEGKKIHLLAISLGAMVATAWADQHPQEVEQLVLINSSSARHSKFYERLKPQNYPRMLNLLAGFKSRFSIQEIEKQILQMTSNSSERRDFALPLWTRESTAHPVTAVNFFRQLWAAKSYTFPSEAPVPTTILASENDRFVDVSCSKNLAKAWRCPIYTHPWAGHDLPLDDGEWVIAQIKKRNTLSP